jgi:hypothetical protein
MAGGALLLAQATAAAGYPGLLPGFLVLGFGTGLALPAASVTALAETGPGSAGFASGFLALPTNSARRSGWRCSPRSRPWPRGAR